MPPRLRLPALDFAPLVFLGVALLVPPFAVLLRGVLVLDLALETLKWLEVPEALAIERILTMRSEIARGVGRSRLLAEALHLASRYLGRDAGETYAIFQRSRSILEIRRRSRGF